MVGTLPLDRRQALAVLGLRGEVDPSALRAAFRAAVKATHPDRAGGDAAKLRQVVEAYGLLKVPPPGPLQTPPPAPLPPAPALPETLQISPALAASGGNVFVSLADGRRLRVALPAGLRPGDRVRAGEALLTVSVAGGPALTLRGDDLWLTTDLPDDAPDGGRIDLQTPTGSREIWVGRRAMRRGLIRLAGEGLPARGPHAAGDLIVRLRPAGRAESGTRSALKAFAAAWAPQALQATAL